MCKTKIFCYKQICFISYSISQENLQVKLLRIFYLLWDITHKGVRHVVLRGTQDSEHIHQEIINKLYYRFKISVCKTRFTNWTIWTNWTRSKLRNLTFYLSYAQISEIRIKILKCINDSCS